MYIYASYLTLPLNYTNNENYPASNKTYLLYPVIHRAYSYSDLSFHCWYILMYVNTMHNIIYLYPIKKECFLIKKAPVTRKPLILKVYILKIPSYPEREVIAYGVLGGEAPVIVPVKLPAMYPPTGPYSVMFTIIGVEITV